LTSTVRCGARFPHFGSARTGSDKMPYVLRPTYRLAVAECFGRHDPAKNNTIKISVASNARSPLARDWHSPRVRRIQSRSIVELGTMEERDERHGDDQPDQRDRPQR
jgi:hypothetical protein